MDHLRSIKVRDYTEEGSYKKFTNFRSKVIGLTKVTGNYFEKLVMALENGLKDVNNSSTRKNEFFWMCDRCTFLNKDVHTVCQMCTGH